MVDGKMDRLKDGQMERWIDANMYRWIDGKMDRIHKIPDKISKDFSVGV